MKYCAYCGHSLLDDAYFCQKCGKSTDIKKDNNEENNHLDSLDVVSTYSERKNKRGRLRVIIIGVCTFLMVAVAISFLIHWNTKKDFVKFYKETQAPIQSMNAVTKKLKTSLDDFLNKRGQGGSYEAFIKVSSESKLQLQNNNKQLLDIQIPSSLDKYSSSTKLILGYYDSLIKTKIELIDLTVQQANLLMQGKAISGIKDFDDKIKSKSEYIDFCDRTASSQLLNIKNNLGISDEEMYK